MKKYFMLCLLMSFAVYTGCQNTDNPVADSSQQGLTNTLDETNEFAQAAEEFDQLQPELDAEVTELMASYQQASVVAKKQRSANSIAGSKITVPDDFPTIKAAVAAASPGDKIKVTEAGSPYVGTVVVPVPNIRITAEGDVLLRGRFIVRADGVQIDHFNIRGTASPASYGIRLIRVTDVEIKDNNIFRNPRGRGIIVDRSQDCNIKTNNVSRCRIGIDVNRSRDNEIDENNVRNCLGGIGLFRSHDNTVSGNTSNRNVDGYGIFLGSSENHHKDNIGSNNRRDGIILHAGANNNTIGSDNVFNNNGRFGIALAPPTFENEIKKNEATGNSVFDMIDAGTDNEFENNDTDVTDPPGLD